MSDIEDIIFEAGEDCCDLAGTVRNRRRPSRLDYECNFAADWTFEDLNEMTQQGMRMLP